MSLAPSPILLVEDDQLTLQATAQSLRNEGLEVSCATSAGEALQILQDGFDPALVISDVHLEGEPDGIALARAVAEGWPQARLILVSGACRPARGEYPEKAVFFTKPYPSGALLTLINRADW